MSQIPASVEYPPHDRGAKTVAKPPCTTEQKLLVFFQSLYHKRIIRSFVHVKQYHFGACCTSSVKIVAKQRDASALAYVELSAEPRYYVRTAMRFRWPLFLPASVFHTTNFASGLGHASNSDGRLFSSVGRDVGRPRNPLSIPSSGIVLT